MNTPEQQHLKKMKKQIFWIKFKLKKELFCLKIKRYFFLHCAMKTYWSLMGIMLFFALLNMYFAITGFMDRYKFNKKSRILIENGEKAINQADSLKNVYQGLINQLEEKQD